MKTIEAFEESQCQGKINLHTSTYLYFKHGQRWRDGSTGKRTCGNTVNISD